MGRVGTGGWGKSDVNQDVQVLSLGQVSSSTEIYEKQIAQHFMGNIQLNLKYLSEMS